jgi:Na+/H+ antiporter NhaD/arsenite permease-like protein
MSRLSTTRTKGGGRRDFPVFTIRRCTPFPALIKGLAGVAAVLAPAVGSAAEADHGTLSLDLTHHWAGILSLAFFVFAYLFVIFEEFIHLRKSKPVVVAAGFIWIIVAVVYAARGDTGTVAAAIRDNLTEYAELLLFLLCAMTYINTMEERNVFHALRGWLVSSGFSLRVIFWLTGLLAFFISPIADNLTTSLVMAAVVMAVAAGNTTFIALSCINIVVAANAGGAFSPFGDITTLMVWQKGVVKFFEFFNLFIPSLVNWFVPALCMSLAVPAGRPEPLRHAVAVKFGGYVVVALFLATIVLTVMMHNYLHMPPFLGMMTGLGILKLYGYYIRKMDIKNHNGSAPYRDSELSDADSEVRSRIDEHFKPRHKPFDIFISVKRVEWDTLLFFYGVMLCVGGLNIIGYLALLSQSFYTGLGPTVANTLVGIISSLVDNIPVMYAVLTMNPDMSHGQWLLVTLTAGVGGSLLSIGSAAGVALMGQARGIYTFFAHLKWLWAVALGYALSIWLHLLINGRLFDAATGVP